MGLALVVLGVACCVASVALLLLGLRQSAPDESGGVSATVRDDRHADRPSQAVSDHRVTWRDEHFFI